MTFIDVKDLRRVYPGGVEALKGLDFSVDKGELFGVVGPDGAGKTTLIKILAGLMPFEGEATFEGEKLTPNATFLRRQIGYIPQRFSLYTDLSVEENIKFFAGLYPHEGGRDRNEMLEFIGLSRFKNRLAGALSGGMKQKLALVCALVHGPKILLMDEPTVGVDPVSRREFLSLIFELQADGLTVISSTPYMDEAEQFDRVGLLDQGRFLQIGTVDDLKASVEGEVVRIYSDDPPETRRRVVKLPYVSDAQLFGDRVHVFVPPKSQARQRLVQDLQLNPDEVEQAEFSVEDIFLIKTGEAHV